MLLTEAFDIDVSPGVGSLSNSDDERCEPIENTIQLAWQPSFAEEYKRLLGGSGKIESNSAGKQEMYLENALCAVARDVEDHR